MPQMSPLPANIKLISKDGVAANNFHLVDAS
jgi:hypothetical protein